MLGVIWSQKLLQSQHWVLLLVWHDAVLLLDVGSFSSHSFDQEKHKLLQVLVVGHCIDSEVMWEDEWRHDVTIVSDHPKHNDVNRVFGFHQYQYIL